MTRAANARLRSFSSAARGLLALLLCLPGLAAAQSPPTPPPAGAHAVPGWYLGMPVLLHGAPPPAGADRQKLDQFPVYVHAPVSPSAGAAANKLLPHPRTGEQVTLPPHQDTLSALNSATKARLGVGYFVISGPKASEDTVRVQPQPAKSWPGAPLVSHILIGPEWVPVNNHLVVEYGVTTGQLALEFFDVAGMMWGEFMDPAAKRLGTIDTRIEHTATLPAIDWQHDKDYKPGAPPPR